MSLIASILIALCSLFGHVQPSYNLPTGIHVDNIESVLVLNSESFGDYRPTSDVCNYQIIVINHTFDDSDLVLTRNCNRVEFSAVLAVALSDFTLIEY